MPTLKKEALTMGKIELNIEGEIKEYDSEITYEAIALEYQSKYDDQIALVEENHQLRELAAKPFLGADSDEAAKNIKFITLRDSIGHKCYVRTAVFLTVKAFHDVLEQEGFMPYSEELKCEFAIGKGLYFTSKREPVVISGQALTIDENLVNKVKARMQELVDDKLPINKYSYKTKEAMKYFSAANMKDKYELFKYRRSSNVNVYELDGYKDYYYGYMLPNTSYIKHFNLLQYKDGFVLVCPEAKNPTVVPEFVPLEKLYSSMMTTTNWGETLGVNTVADLNDKISEGNINDVILIQEALQERRIGEIAKEIAERKGVKFVMIAGPSSSGKTSFSHRLSIQLATYGLKPHPIAVDDYFVNREDTPLDEDGNYNFECIEAIDTKQFNEDMLALLNGKRVELPSFNFKTGKREYKGNYKQLAQDEILVIEGIHGLNDKMSYALPNESKFKIYISALTCLNIDEHNRIPTTDVRLIRRMVRDARTRGTSAKGTISMWPSVRRGEEENIFPFQESADATFNSALIYELAVLKQFAEPLLFAIGEEDSEYHEAKRLLKFLDYFLGISSEGLPNNSLVREFVGGSVFPV